MIVFILVFILLSSCSQNVSVDYDLSEECGGKCYAAHDINSLQDALVNSAAAFSNCICLGSGVFEGSVTVAKPLRLFGRKDGSTYLKNLAILDTSGVILRDFSFKNVSTDSAALFWKFCRNGEYLFFRGKCEFSFRRSRDRDFGQRIRCSDKEFENGKN